MLPRDQPLVEEAVFVTGRGLKLFRLVRDNDLEGVVAKRKDGLYSANSPRLKIKNPNYSQAEGRGKLFNRPKRSRGGG